RMACSSPRSACFRPRWTVWCAHQPTATTTVAAARGTIHSRNLGKRFIGAHTPRDPGGHVGAGRRPYEAGSWRRAPTGGNALNAEPFRQIEEPPGPHLTCDSRSRGKMPFSTRPTEGVNARHGRA